MPRCGAREALGTELRSLNLAANPYPFNSSELLIPFIRLRNIPQWLERFLAQPS